MHPQMNQALGAARQQELLDAAAEYGLYSFDFYENALKDPTGLTLLLCLEELAKADAGSALLLFGSCLGAVSTHTAPFARQSLSLHRHKVRNDPDRRTVTHARSASRVEVRHERQDLCDRRCQLRGRQGSNRAARARL